jgi:hypothetical protein
VAAANDAAISAIATKSVTALSSASRGATTSAAAAAADAAASAAPNDHKDPAGGVVCRMSRRWVSDAVRTDVQVRIGGVEFFVDLFGNPPRLLQEDTIDARVSSAVALSLALALFRSAPLSRPRARPLPLSL